MTLEELARDLLKMDMGSDYTDELADCPHCIDAARAVVLRIAEWLDSECRCKDIAAELRAIAAKPGAQQEADTNG